MSKGKTLTHEHSHTKMVNRAASNKKIDTVGLTVILGMLAGVFICCLIIDPRNDSLKEIALELLKYVGGGTSAGAILGLIIGEILRREHLSLNLIYQDKYQLGTQTTKRIKEKEMPQSTFLGDHTRGDHPRPKEYDELLMRR